MKLNLQKIIPVLRVLAEILATFNARKKSPTYAFSEFLSKLTRRDP